eukprot:scaffold97782_cov36-Cyclotella_meneghiniana.AAC.1
MARRVINPFVASWAKISTQSDSGLRDVGETYNMMVHSFASSAVRVLSRCMRALALANRCSST